MRNYLFRKFTINTEFSVGDGFRPSRIASAIFGTYIIFRKQQEPVFKEFKIFENRFLFIIKRLAARDRNPSPTIFVTN